MKKLIIASLIALSTTSVAMASPSVGDIVTVTTEIPSSQAIIVDEEWSTVRINPKNMMVVEVDNHQPGFAYKNAVVGDKYTENIENCTGVSDTNWQDSRFITFKDNETKNLVRETIKNGIIEEITVIHSSLNHC